MVLASRPIWKGICVCSCRKWVVSWKAHFTASILSRRYVTLYFKIAEKQSNVLCDVLHVVESEQLLQDTD